MVITEGVPVQDTAEVLAYLEGNSGTRMIGPNCPGIITPEESLAGITPHTIAGKGPIGLVSKSGTLTYQMMFELRDHGFSTAIGIGGDPIIGTTHIDALEAFEKDPDTKAIVMIGEIGGDAEERAADYIKDHVTKPVVGYVAGFTAPEGKTMGHAGAIVSGSSGTAAGQEGGPRGRRGQGRQDAVGDRPADAGDPRDALTARRFHRSAGETCSLSARNFTHRSDELHPVDSGEPTRSPLRDRVAGGVRRVGVLLAAPSPARGGSTAACDVVEGVVERGEAEAGDVGVAEVADRPRGRSAPGPRRTPRRGAARPGCRAGRARAG